MTILSTNHVVGDPGHVEDHNTIVFLLQTAQQTSDKYQPNGYPGLDSNARLPTLMLPVGVEYNTNKGTANGYAGLDSLARVPTAQLPATTEYNTNKGNANGYAGLDSGGRVPSTQLPTTVEYNSNKGVANGYASLDSGTRVPTSQLPTTVEYTSNKGVANGYASLDSGGRVPTAQLPAAAGGLLASAQYAPASNSAYTTTSASLVAIDTTNLTLSFVAPSSGSVIVRFSGRINGNSAGSGAAANVALFTHGTTTQVGTTHYFDIDTVATMLDALSWKITGLTGGNTYQYDLAWAQGGSITLTMNVQGLTGVGATSMPGGATGPALLEAWSA